MSILYKYNKLLRYYFISRQTVLNVKQTLCGSNISHKSDVIEGILTAGTNGQPLVSLIYCTLPQQTILFCSVHPYWMHWATRWHCSVLSAASYLAYSQVMSMFFRLHFTMSVQFVHGRPGFLLYPFSSHSVAWWGILEFSIPTIHRTCPNHLKSSLIMSSILCKLVVMINKLTTTRMS